MGRKRIEKRLKRYAAVCGKLRPEKREDRIRELLRMDAGLRTRGNLWDFILEQVGYLGRYCLFWQMLWIALFCWLMRYGIRTFHGMDGGNGVLVMVSLLPPVLVLLTVEEVTKVYQRSMLEIEYATKYSLRSAVMIRMVVLCTFHSLILAVCIICWHGRLDSGMGRLFVYGFTPMVIMTGVLLKLMQHCQGELLRDAAMGVYALTAALTVVGNTGHFRWYQPAFFRIWCVACVAGITFGIRQFVCLNRKLAHFEQIAW